VYTGSWPYQGTSARVDVQSDGNLVAYDSSNNVLWASNTNGRGTGPYKLVMQNDANLVLYDSTNAALWSSNKHVVSFPGGGGEPSYP